MGGNDLESNFEIVLKSYKNSGNNIISQNKSSIAGEDAYEILFTADSGNTHVKQKETGANTIISCIQLLSF
jgi:hypothetical protein